MKTNRNYYEIGRGAKLIPMEYWHQYLLSIDLTEQNKIFVVSEIGKSEVLYQKKLSIEDLLKEEWNELLTKSLTKTFITQLKINYTNDENLKIELADVVEDLEKIEVLLNGSWTSIDEYDNLDYNSNFGNWVDASPIKGKLRFSLDLNTQETKNCKIEIPVNYWTLGDGYYSIIYGRFQLSKNQLLVWENEIFPHQIKFNLSNEVLILQLYDNEIRFTKE